MSCAATMQSAGDALVAVLTGKYNPAGRLPNTWPASLNDVPAITNYTMSQRTYRYSTHQPLYPFGYGLYVPINETWFNPMSCVFCAVIGVAYTLG